MLWDYSFNFIGDVMLILNDFSSAWALGCCAQTSCKKRKQAVITSNKLKWTQLLADLVGLVSFPGTFTGQDLCHLNFCIPEPRLIYFHFFLFRPLSFICFRLVSAYYNLNIFLEQLQFSYQEIFANFFFETYVNQRFKNYNAKKKIGADAWFLSHHIELKHSECF